MRTCGLCGPASAAFTSSIVSGLKSRTNHNRASRSTASRRISKICRISLALSYGVGMAAHFNAKRTIFTRRRGVFLFSASPRLRVNRLSSTSRVFGANDHEGHVIVWRTVAVPAFRGGGQRGDHVVRGGAVCGGDEFVDRGGAAELLPCSVLQFREPIRHAQHRIAAIQIYAGVMIVGAKGAERRGAARDFFDRAA